MLTLIALGIAIQAARPTPDPEGLTKADALALLASVGYPCSSKDSPYLVGTMAHGGVSASLGSASKPRADGDSGPERLIGIQLQVEVALGEDVPLSEGGRPFASWAPSPDPYVIPHLGRTATLIQDIEFGDGESPARLRKALDKFWRDAAAYARRHRAAFANPPRRDWSQARFPAGFVLDRADDDSFDRAAASWGYKPVREWIEPSIFQHHNYEVDGEKVMVTAGDPRMATDRLAYHLTANLRLPPGVDALAWATSHAKADPTTEFSASREALVIVIERVDTTKGVSLGELRRRVEAFAARVKGLQSSIRDTP